MSRLDPRLLLQGYASGIFPMADCREADDLFWVEPRNRAILPLEKFRRNLFGLPKWNHPLIRGRAALRALLGCSS